MSQIMRKTRVSFFDEVSNFNNRILINQKPELAIRNSQWNCMIDAQFTLINVYYAI